MYQSPITDDEVKIWYKHHIEDKLSHTEIGKLYNIHRETVRRHFKKRGWKSYNYQNMNKHNINKFSSIKTEEDAYWLGFIYADGYVSDQNNFEVSLKLSDKKHLEKLKEYLELKLPIYTDDYRCRLIYKNSYLVNNLKKLSITPRKSLTLKFPYGIMSKELYRHFIRGYFDGDGSVSFYKIKSKKLKILSLSLLGTKSFLDGVRKYSPIQFSKYVKNNGSNETLVLSVSHKKADIFGYWLYSDCNIYLDRKYKKYMNAHLIRNNHFELRD